MAKYDPLRDHLASRTEDSISMTFAEVEGLIGKLPPSARSDSEYWANNSKVQAKAWRAAGWHVDSAVLTEEQVVFARGEVGGTSAARIRNGEHSMVSKASIQRAADDEKFCPQCYVAVPGTGICDSCTA